MITLTENAAKEIRKIMSENELGEEVAVRVGAVSYTHLRAHET